MVIDLIKSSFSKRQKPLRFIEECNELMDTEREEVNEICLKDRYEISCEDLVHNYNVIYWMSAEAFNYYLPGILCACILENNPKMLIIDNLVNMLDRTPDFKGWDDFFINRWAKLSSKECSACQEWILWLEDHGYEPMAYNALERAYETLELIKSRHKH